MGCSIFVLERYQGCPGDRRKKSVKQADPENSKSRKRTGSGLRAARVMSDAASNVMLHLRGVGHVGFEESALQNNNVSFTMSDKSAIPFGKLVRPSCWLMLLLINDP
jgi:hypothetical protein